MLLDSFADNLLYFPIVTQVILLNYIKIVASEKLNIATSVFPNIVHLICVVLRLDAAGGVSDACT